jgi:transcriptional regulator with XRE-family HTH domain
MSQVAAEPARIGPLLRDWRERRRMSQLDLALGAGVSARHVSFIETGRSKPSAEMVVQLAEYLDVPLRDRNGLLLAAGYAPAYGQRGLDEPEMGPVRDAIDRVLRGHEPYPAVVVDRHWGLMAANRTVPILTEGSADHLLEPPANVLRIRAGDAELAFISTATTFGTAVDVTVSELSIESFFPADDQTASYLHAQKLG